MAKLAPYVFWQALDNNGDPLSGGKVYTYEAGTVTPKATYSDVTEATANANPIILDANGRSNIWLTDGAYKFVIYDSNDVLIDTADDITGDASNVFGSSVVDVAGNLNVSAVYQNYIINCTAALTLSLLDVATAGEGFIFSVKNESAGNITVDPDGSELIDGAATLTVYPNESCAIICTGTEWIVLFKDTVSASANNTLTGDNTFTGEHILQSILKIQGKVTSTDAGERTIAGGIITITGLFHTVDTETDDPSDDLDTINTPSNGQWVILRAEHTDRTVVVKHGTGNIIIPNGNDVTLDTTSRVLGFIYDNDLAAWVLSYDGTTKEYVDSEIAAVVTSGTVAAAGSVTDNVTGMITKWGVYGGASAGATLTFPVQFPSNCFSVVVTCAVANRVTAVTSVAATGFVFSSTIATTGAASAIGFYWVATGN